MRSSRARTTSRSVVALAMLAWLAAVSCANGGGDAGPEAEADASPPEEPATTTTEPECGPGGRTVEREGRRIREFCGPGRARVTVGDETFTFDGGECLRTLESVEVHLGAEAVEPAAGPEITQPQFASFTLLMGRGELATDVGVPIATDGAYTVGTLTFTIPGRSWVVDDKTVTLVASRTAGTFTGQALPFGAHRDEADGAPDPDDSATNQESGGTDAPDEPPDGNPSDTDGTDTDDTGTDDTGTDASSPPTTTPGIRAGGAFTCDDTVIPLDTVPELAGTAPFGTDTDPADGDGDGDGAP